MGLTTLAFANNLHFQTVFGPKRKILASTTEIREITKNSKPPVLPEGRGNDMSLSQISTLVFLLACAPNTKDIKGNSLLFAILRKSRASNAIADIINDNNPKHSYRVEISRISGDLTIHKDDTTSRESPKRSIISPSPVVIDDIPHTVFRSTKLHDDVLILKNDFFKEIRKHY